MHRPCPEQNVIETHRGNDHAEDAYASADALRLEVVAQHGSSVEFVAANFQLVEFVETGHDLLLVRAGVGENIAYVIDGIVYPVGLDAVVGFYALADVVLHLHSHHFIVRNSECSHE